MLDTTLLAETATLSTIPSHLQGRSLVGRAVSAQRLSVTRLRPTTRVQKPDASPRGPPLASPHAECRDSVQWQQRTDGISGCWGAVMGRSPFRTPRSHSVHPSSTEQTFPKLSLFSVGFTQRAQLLLCPRCCPRWHLEPRGPVCVLHTATCGSSPHQGITPGPPEHLPLVNPARMLLGGMATCPRPRLHTGDTPVPLWPL